MDVRPAVYLVPANEATEQQRLEFVGDDAVVVRQHFDLDEARPVLEVARLVGQRPQPGEQQAGQREQLGQVFILEERRFQIPNTGHLVLLPFPRRVAEAARVVLARRALPDFAGHDGVHDRVVVGEPDIFR